MAQNLIRVFYSILSNSENVVFIVIVVVAWWMTDRDDLSDALSRPVP
jgi:hypothetical protein